MIKKAENDTRKAGTQSWSIGVMLTNRSSCGLTETISALSGMSVREEKLQTAAFLHNMPILNAVLILCFASQPDEIFVCLDWYFA